MEGGGLATFSLCQSCARKKSSDIIYSRSLRTNDLPDDWKATPPMITSLGAALAATGGTGTGGLAAGLGAAPRAGGL